MIDKSGTWWKGEDAADLHQFITEFTADGYPASRITTSQCGGCGGSEFSLEADDDEGCAQRQCAACGLAAFIGDSEEYWEDAEPYQVTCPCGGERFQVSVGFAFRDDGDVRWIYVGGRCVACGVLGVYVDWKIDYSPTDHLLTAV